MTRYVVLIRGINVGATRKLPMARLREVCGALGCTDVTTYIQSGNVVLDSPQSPGPLCDGLEAGIEEAVGFRPRVVTREPGDLARVLATRPFPDADESKLHVGFMNATPSAKAVAGLDDVDPEPEGFAVIGDEIYFHAPNGLGRSTMMKVPFERRLGVAITVRNWRTVTKLHELATA